MPVLESISLVILIILPSLSLRVLYKIKNIDYKETIIEYKRGKKKKEFQLVTKLRFCLHFVLIQGIVTDCMKLLINEQSRLYRKRD